MKKNVAILMGGYSSEYAVSIKSAEVVYENLKKESNLNLFKIYITKNKWYYLNESGKKFHINKNSFTLKINNKKIIFDIVFNAIHGIPGENGEIQSYLKKLNIPQTSSEANESKITFDKNLCKKKIRHININTPNSIIIKKNAAVNIEGIIKKIRLPFFIKPNNGGSSFGISRVENKNHIIEALKKCFLEDNEALVEEEINGREITVGVIIYKNKILALPPTEIKSHNSFFDFNAKYKGESDEITPANITKENETIIQNLAIKIFKKLKLKGFTRSDFILTDDKFYFLEINTIPGLTKESILPQQAQEAGISLKNLFKSVIE